jgi:hypothetical protein
METTLMNNRLDHLKGFYELLAILEKKVGGKRHLAECHGKMRWSKRGGVYFFFDQGEPRLESGKGDRVVRVGSTGGPIWKRLGNHRGNAATGGGTNGNSQFRVLVSAAIVTRHEPGITPKKRTDLSKSHIIQKEVSRYIGKMPFL